VSTRNRNRLVAACLVGAMCTGGLGIYVGRNLASPESLVPPKPIPAPVLVPVEERQLRTQFAARGTVALAGYQPVVAPTNSAAAQVVTRTPEPGVMIKEGEEVFSIDDRPMLAFEGLIPAYRDLEPSDSGRDVLQLNQSLQRLGMYSGPVTDQFDDRTELGLERAFRARGATPIGPSKADLNLLAAARKQLNAAEVAVLESQQELGVIAKPAADDLLIGAREAVAAANDALANFPEEADRIRRESKAAVRQKQRAVLDAKAAVRKAELDLSEFVKSLDDQTTVRAAERAVEEARGKITLAKEGVDTAIQAVADSKAEVQLAKDALGPAQEVRDTLKRKADALLAEAARLKAEGPKLPADGVVLTNPEIQALFQAADDAARDAVAAVTQAENGQRALEREVLAKLRAVTAAEKGVVTAKQAVVDAERAVPAAVAAVTKASSDLALRRELLTVEQEKPSVARDALDQALVEEAAAIRADTKVEATIGAKLRVLQSQSQTANAALRRLGVAPDSKNLKLKVETALRARAAEAEDLQELESRIGIKLPLASYVFVPSLPAEVSSVDTPAGSVVADRPIIALSGGNLLVNALVETIEQSRITRNLPVTIEIQNFQVSARGIVSSAPRKPLPEDPNASPFGVQFDGKTIRGADGNPVPEALLVGAEARVIVELTKMKKPGLVVPLGSVTTRSDQSTAVAVKRSPKTPFETVRVKVGVAADGFVEVVPLVAGTLKVGDLVNVSEPPSEPSEPGTPNGAVDVIVPNEGLKPEIEPDDGYEPQ
jgi:peptidoglycan hydrolase-like protein with peptidoglycan-binding domain